MVFLQRSETLESKKVIIYTDGGSRGNPGPAAAGFVITDSTGKKLSAKGLFLGKNTNNFAEYSGLVEALKKAKKLAAEQVLIYSDSELLVRQINGQYKVKSDTIRPLYEEAMSMLLMFKGFDVKHVTRDKNSEADSLVNQALDMKANVEAKQAVTTSRTNKKKIRLGVLLSGGGRTLINILDYIKQGKLNAEVAVVISSLSTVAGVQRAKGAGLKVEVVRKKDNPDIDQFSGKIEKILVAADVDLVIQAGWLCLWNIPDKFANRVMNIHPALLPAFGGQGMWGHHVHEAVLQRGCKVSGCTVHFCTNEYDKGPIIVQRVCEVKNDDTADTLAARVFEQECIAYPQAIALFADDRLIVKGNRVFVKQ